MTCILAILACWLSVSYGSLLCDVKAPLPMSEPPIDPHQLNGTWYLTLASSDPIATDHICATLQDIHVNPSGFDGLFTAYYEGGGKSAFPIHQLYRSDGYFEHGPAVEKQFQNEFENANGHINMAAVAQAIIMEWTEYTLLGVPGDYFAYVRCNPSGWVTWVFTKEKQLTAKRILYIHNELMKYGVAAPFLLNDCQNA